MTTRFFCCWQREIGLIYLKYEQYKSFRSFLCLHITYPMRGIIEINYKQCLTLSCMIQPEMYMHDVIIHHIRQWAYHQGIILKHQILSETICRQKDTRIRICVFGCCMDNVKMQKRDFSFCPRKEVNYESNK